MNKRVVLWLMANVVVFGSAAIMIFVDFFGGFMTLALGSVAFSVIGRHLDWRSPMIRRIDAWSAERAKEAIK